MLYKCWLLSLFLLLFHLFWFTYFCYCPIIYGLVNLSLSCNGMRLISVVAESCCYYLDLWPRRPSGWLAGFLSSILSLSHPFILPSAHLFIQYWLNFMLQTYSYGPRKSWFLPIVCSWSIKDITQNNIFLKGTKQINKISINCNKCSKNMPQN